MLEVIKNPILCGMIVSFVIPFGLLIASEIQDYFFNKKLAMTNKNK
ncbi:hypothetical protein BM892_002776 [Escherichia coli]|nr:hypothetical protein [Escherichia coli]